MMGHQESDLGSFFAEANQELKGQEFCSQLMLRIARHKRRVLQGRIALSIALVLIALPLQEFLLPFYQLPVLPVLTIENDLLAQVLLPLNTLGAVFTLLLLLLRIAYRKLFTVLL